MKAWLSHHGVAHEERNVDEDLDAYDALVALGFRTVPVTVIDGVGVAGFQPERLQELLAARAARDPGRG